MIQRRQEMELRPTLRDNVTVTLSAITTECSLGAYAHEKLRRRTITVNVMYEYDAGRATRSDRLRQAVDYKTIRNEIIRVAGLRHYNLVESLVNELVAAIAADERIARVQVEVIKPQALKKTAAVSVIASWCRPR